MTSNDFRRLALSFPETSEQAHMDHPDFRVAGKIFATLGYPEDGWGMVKLTPIEQGMFMRAHRGFFEPCAGAWGRRGATTSASRPRESIPCAARSSPRGCLPLPSPSPANSRKIARRPEKLSPPRAFFTSGSDHSLPPHV